MELAGKSESPGRRDAGLSWCAGCGAMQRSIASWCMRHKRGVCFHEGPLCMYSLSVCVYVFLHAHSHEHQPAWTSSCIVRVWMVVGHSVVFVALRQDCAAPHNLRRNKSRVSVSFAYVCLRASPVLQERKFGLNPRTLRLLTLSPKAKSLSLWHRLAQLRWPRAVRARFRKSLAGSSCE